jgi:hypothetical protein
MMEPNKPQREKWSMVAQNWSEVSWEQMASTLREDYSEIMKQYQTKGGLRDRKYQNLQGNYLMFYKLKGDLAERERFEADPYWHGFHQPPKDRNLMLSVLTYNMQSKHDEPIQTLNYKYAKVLSSFYDGNVAPDNVAQRLKDGGGIYFIYAQLCKAEKLRREEPLAQSKSDGLGAADDEHPDADEDAELIVDEDAEQAALEDGHVSDDAIVPGANLPTGDQVASPPPAMPRAANDQPDEVKREDRSITQSNQRLHHRIDEATELIVKFHALELEQIRASGGGEITIYVMPREEDGYWPTIGSIKRLFPHNEGPSPNDAEEPPAAA